MNEEKDDQGSEKKIKPIKTIIEVKNDRTFR
jgi:hypothetical protein